MVCGNDPWAEHGVEADSGDGLPVASCRRLTWPSVRSLHLGCMVLVLDVDTVLISLDRLDVLTWSERSPMRGSYLRKGSCARIPSSASPASTHLGFLQQKGKTSNLLEQ